MFARWACDVSSWLCSACSCKLRMAAAPQKAPLTLGRALALAARASGRCEEIRLRQLIFLFVLVCDVFTGTIRSDVCHFVSFCLWKSLI